MLNNPAILAAIIGALATVVAAIISVRVNKVNNRTNDQKVKEKDKKPRSIIWPGLILFIVIMAGVQYWQYDLKNDSMKFWVGVWVHTEEWSDGSVSEGVLELSKIRGISNELSGYSFNRKQEKTTLKAEILAHKQTMEGTWKNTVNERQGTFEFTFESNSSYAGYYIYEEIKKSWIGVKFDGEFSHELRVENSSNSLGFRSQLLTSNELDEINSGKNIHEETLIGALINGQKIEVLDFKGNQYKVLTRFRNEMRLGYIVSQYAGEITIIELKE